MSESIYNSLSKERKKLQEEGLVPLWYTTAGYQMFKAKYLYGTDKSVRGQFERIAKSAASYVLAQYPTAESKFFELLWNGWLSPSTPVLANMGTDRGMPVSCSGTVVEDSIDGFYSNLHEVAMLSKNGFGTASDLSNIRPRGTSISIGGKSSGVIPVIREHVMVSRNVSQGSQRRGAWAAYLDIEHGDFDEVISLLIKEPDDLNIGWVVKQTFIDRLNSGDTSATDRFSKAMKVKMITGKGYFCFVDKADLKRPQMYIDRGMQVAAYQLCNEITLYNDAEHSYTCVLSSMNIFKYDEWMNTDAVFWATVFLDCVASEFILKAANKPGLQKAVRFTEKSRALGLGVCGLHSLFQSRMIPFESYDAHMLSQEIQSHIFTNAKAATRDMAEKLGEPEWCKGYGVRNTHLLAIAPTKSTALLMGGISEGINPDPAMVFTQDTAAGEMNRMTPMLLELMKKKGKYNKKIIQDLTDHQGSVQHVDWLSAQEKQVFKTAFEINQKSVLRMAAARGKYLDQWQSLNLFFGADEDPAWIAEVHQEAFNDPAILGLYYVYTQAGVQASKETCEACM